jgi:prophage tail gpP-like protein
MSDVLIIITDIFNKELVRDPNYSSYTFESNVFTMTDTFSMELILEIGEKIDDWHGIQMYIDNVIEFNGIIQKTQRNSSKTNLSITISGKDRGKFIVESFCTSFKDFVNQPPKSIIQKLIDQTNFYPQNPSSVTPVVPTANWDDISDVTTYNTTVSSNISQNKAFTTRRDQTVFDIAFNALPPKATFKIEPGDMVFDKMNDLCRSVGLYMMYLQDGTLFFGDINKKRLNETSPIQYALNFTEDDRGNNMLAAPVSDDNSGLYSDITVISQAQGKATKSATAINSAAQEKKQMIVVINDDEASPKKEAIRIREDQRTESFSVSYRVDDHKADNGKTWVVNKSVNIFDRINDVVGQFVLYGVTFTFSDGRGKETILNIGLERQDYLAI